MRRSALSRLSLCVAAIGALAASTYLVAPSLASEDAVVIPAPVLDVQGADGLQRIVDEENA